MIYGAIFQTFNLNGKVSFYLVTTICQTLQWVPRVDLLTKSILGNLIVKRFVHFSLSILEHGLQLNFSAGALCVLVAMASQCEQSKIGSMRRSISVVINISDFEEPCASENVALRQLVADDIDNKNEAW